MQFYLYLFKAIFGGKEEVKLNTKSIMYRLFV